MNGGRGLRLEFIIHNGQHQLMTAAAPFQYLFMGIMNGGRVEIGIHHFSYQECEYLGLYMQIYSTQPSLNNAYHHGLRTIKETLYAEPRYSIVKRSDGTYTIIPVTEGFSQGCPFSPIFAAIVLYEILPNFVCVD
eukprot:scaffold14828_cov64-Cyclotella_meneghiniana.AAC.8